MLTMFDDIFKSGHCFARCSIQSELIQLLVSPVHKQSKFSLSNFDQKIVKNECQTDYLFMCFLFENCSNRIKWHYGSQQNDTNKAKKIALYIV